MASLPWRMDFHPSFPLEDKDVYAPFGRPGQIVQFGPGRAEFRKAGGNGVDIALEEPRQVGSHRGHKSDGYAAPRRRTASASSTARRRERRRFGEENAELFIFAPMATVQDWTEIGGACRRIKPIGLPKPDSIWRWECHWWRRSMARGRRLPRAQESRETSLRDGCRE